MSVCDLRFLVLPVFLVLASCGDSGGAAGPSPHISNLQLSQSSAEFMEGGGAITIQAQLDYSDRQADIANLRIEVSDGTNLTIPIPGPQDSRKGTIGGDGTLPTNTSGVLDVVVWVIDSAGNVSNELTTTFTVDGSTRLIDLGMSAGSFDQIFQPSLMDYTATVSLLQPTTTVSASVEDPNSMLTVGGNPVVSGVPSSKVTLDVGLNTVDVRVTTFDGARSETYFIDVMRESSVSLGQTAYVKASNTDADDWFGAGMALDGGTLVVGAPWEASAAAGVDGDQSDDSAVLAGAAYVYSRDGAGGWTQWAYLKTSNPDSGDVAGFNIALDTNTLVMCATGEDSAAVGIDGDQDDNTANSAGAAYVFTRDAGGLWPQQAYIKASNTDADDLFGWSAVLERDTLVVAAVGEDGAGTGINDDHLDNSADEAGAAYVFVRGTNGTWVQQAYLKASNTEPRDFFGPAIAMHENTLAIGAPGEDSGATTVNGDQADNSAEDAGAVYVFTRDSSDAWTQQAFIKASNTDPGDFFGSAVALHGDTLVVGSAREDSITTGVNGDQSDNSAESAGAVYVFVRDDGGVWTQQAYLKSSNAEEGDGFGEALALIGDTLLVGAWYEAGASSGVGGDDADNSAINAGAAYLFTRDADGVWTQQAYIKASNTDAGDSFARSLALDQDTFAIGAIGEDSAATGIGGDQADNTTWSSGAVYIFE